MTQKNSEVLILLNVESCFVDSARDKMKWKWKWKEKRTTETEAIACRVFFDVFKTAVANQKEMRMLNYGGNNISWVIITERFFINFE